MVMRASKTRQLIQDLSKTEVLILDILLKMLAVQKSVDGCKVWGLVAKKLWVCRQIAVERGKQLLMEQVASSSDSMQGLREGRRSPLILGLAGSAKQWKPRSHLGLWLFYLMRLGNHRKIYYMGKGRGFSVPSKPTFILKPANDDESQRRKRLFCRSMTGEHLLPPIPDYRNLGDPNYRSWWRIDQFL